MIPLHRVVGLDISLSATGVAVLEIFEGGKIKLVSTFVCSAGESDGTKTDKGGRLAGLWGEIGHSLKHVRNNVQANADNKGVSIFAEGYSFGSKHAQQTLGEVHGVIHERLWSEHYLPLVYIAPITAKYTACPKWPGRSIANWKAAGKKGPWKRSTPDKEDVLRGLFDQFGLKVATDAEGDAICVAIAGARSLGLISTGNKVVDARVLSRSKK